jgi:hypothetical protein
MIGYVFRSDRRRRAGPGPEKVAFVLSECRTEGFPFVKSSRIYVEDTDRVTTESQEMLLDAFGVYAKWQASE